MRPDLLRNAHSLFECRGPPTVLLGLKQMAAKRRASEDVEKSVASKLNQGQRHHVERGLDPIEQHRYQPSELLYA